MKPAGPGVCFVGRFSPLDFLNIQVFSSSQVSFSRLRFSVSLSIAPKLPNAWAERKLLMIFPLLSLLPSHSRRPASALLPIGLAGVRHRYPTFQRSSLWVIDFPLVVCSVFSFVASAMFFASAYFGCNRLLFSFSDFSGGSRVPGMRPSFCCSAAAAHCRTFPPNTMSWHPARCEPLLPEVLAPGTPTTRSPPRPCCLVSSQPGDPGLASEVQPVSGRFGQTRSREWCCGRDSRAARAPGTGPAPRATGVRGCCPGTGGHSEGLGSLKEPRLEEGPPP